MAEYTIGLTVEIFAKPSCHVVLMTHLKSILLTPMLPAWGLFSSIAIADFADPNVTSWMDDKKAGIVMQEHENTCGSAAIATVLNGFYGQSVTEKEVADALGIQPIDGTAIAKYLTSQGYELKGKNQKTGVIRLGFDEDLFKYMPAPAIVYINRGLDPVGHWVVLRGIHPTYGVIIADPSLGNLTIPTEDFKKQWLLDKAKTGEPVGSMVILKTPPTNPAYAKQPQPYNPFSH